MTKSFNSADTKRIYYAAKDFTAWNEYVNMTRVLRTHFPESIKSPLELASMAYAAEMQTRPGAVICQGGRYVLGRVAIEKDGSGTLYNGGGAIHFEPDDFVGYAIAVQRDL